MQAQKPQNAADAFVPLQEVRLTDGFWGGFQQRCLHVTLPIELTQLQRTGRLQSLKGTWKPGNAQKPHFFWDSDIAKWIEAVAYSLTFSPDSQLENKVDEIIEDIAAMQQPDGYMNTYFTLVEPGRRFTYLKRMHELYCLGHLIEAAVAYFQATGKRRLLQIVNRYVDLIGRVFGDKEGQICGYDGHEEIELALLKLYGITQNPLHLRLARFFLDQHGKQPHFFELECDKRDEPVEQRKYRDDTQGMYAYYQAHQPVRQQRRAVGHAVRAMYLYCAMQDMVNLTGETSLAEACSALWNNIVTRQLYITGGIGPNPVGERFTFDYDLPNAMSYNETCASIGLVMFAYRRLLHQPEGSVGDVMERCLFNNILGGISLDGKRFYYANPLCVIPEAYENMCDPRPQVTVLRQKWFDVACCPPNLARLAMSLGSYIYQRKDQTLFVHLYINSDAHTELDGADIRISQQSEYPWKGNVLLEIEPSIPARFTLALRLPAWSAGRYRLLENGREAPHQNKDGFLWLERRWKGRVRIELVLDMRVRLTQAQPQVAQDCGRVAIERGPIVYCLEECDNGAQLNDLMILPQTLEEEPYDPQLLGGVVPIQARALRRRAWGEDMLYREWEPDREEVTMRAVPFYARYNRGGGEMTVWIQCRV